MRVLFLTKHDPVRYGQAEVLQQLARALGGERVEVELFSSDPAAKGAHLPGDLALHHGVLPIPQRRGFRHALRELASLCGERDYDLIHAHGVRHPGTAARLLKRRLGMPFVVTSHGDITEASRLRRRRFRRHCGAVLRAADAVTHLSAAMEQSAEALGGSPGLQERIPNGLDLAWWREPCEPIAGDYVLSLGRLVAQKGFDVLVDALEIAARRGASTSLVIAGEGEERERLDARAGRLGIPVLTRLDALADCSRPALCLPGFVAGETKRSLYAGARGVALASQHGEASPLVILEAFAAGRAVLVSDLPSLQPLVQGERNGLRVAPASRDDWAAAFERLYRDEAWRKSCEAENAAAARELGWPGIAAHYAALYRRVVAASS